MSGLRRGERGALTGARLPDQDPNFRAEVERMKAQMMQNPEMQVP